MEQLETDALAKGFQVSASNPMLGIDGRTELLKSLGKSLLNYPKIFGHHGRPGALVGRSIHPFVVPPFESLSNIMYKPHAVFFRGFIKT